MYKDFSRKFFAIWGAGAILAGLFVFALPASAALPAIVPDCARNQGKEAPSLNCALQTFGNIAQLILGITGSFALLMFVYGGFTMLSSGGSSEKVSKGKTILTNAVIGIIIIFGSGLLIQYGMSKLLKDTNTVTIGGACKSGDKQGVGVQMPSGEVKCVATCKEITGYDCKLPTDETLGRCTTTPDCPKAGAPQMMCCP